MKYNIDIKIKRVYKVYKIKLTNLYIYIFKFQHKYTKICYFKQKY